MLNDLFKKVYDEGVEWVELGSVCEIKNGFAFKSNLFKKSGEPIIRISNIQNNNIDKTNIVYFDYNDYKKTNLDNFKIYKNDIIIAMSGATAGKIAINNTNDIYFLNQRVCKFIPNTKFILNKFLYHFIQIKSFEILSKNLSGGAQPNISSEQLKQLKIPLPPLELQNEIVKILDNFTELEKELEKELELRKKQYEYYRNKLLTFADDVEWVELYKLTYWDKKFKGTTKEEQPKTIKFKHISANNLKNIITNNDGNIKLLSTGIFDNYTSLEYCDEEDINDSEVLSIPSGGYANIKYYKGKFIDSGNILCSLRNDNICNLKYIYYYLQNNINLIEFRGSAIQHPNMNKIIKIKIPLPPLATQEKIVEILDKFDKIVNDISEGLPAEISARKKQYEYYRNKLLTFKEK